MGDWDGSWSELRWQREHYYQLGLPAGNPGGLRGAKEWQGQHLAGKTLLVQCEEGIGDQILMIRYVQDLAKRFHARVLARVDPPLVRLFQTAPGVETAVSSDQPPPAFDEFVWMMDLPGKCGTTMQNMPGVVPYLRAPVAESESFQKRIARDGSPRLRVGLRWAGNLRNYRGLSRAIPPGELAGNLSDLDSVEFYSLQKNPEAGAALEGSQDFPLIDLTGELDDMADTAALIANLDLVISVDTAVAHLAGALGKPVWTLLPFSADFRWLIGREDTPWYPTMRLFRQARQRDWSEVLARVRVELNQAGRAQRAPGLHSS
jgi:hypothetical protein